MQKAVSLQGYQSFLSQARSWKAVRKGVPRSFEREVQVHAAQALADGSELATATLRSTRHLKQTGHLDRVLDSWIAAVKASGPVQVPDLWSYVAEDAQARQTLRDQGLADNLFAAIDEQMRKLDGQIALHGGKLTGEIKLTGQERTHASSWRTRLRVNPARFTTCWRGQFERIIEQLEREGALGFDPVVGPLHEGEIAELVVIGTLFSVQSLAQHKRKLEDTGLAMVSGNDPVTALSWVDSIIVMGVICSALFCVGDLDETACTITKYPILGLLLYGRFGLLCKQLAVILVSL